MLLLGASDPIEAHKRVRQTKRSIPRNPNVTLQKLELYVCDKNTLRKLYASFRLVGYNTPGTTRRELAHKTEHLW